LTLTNKEQFFVDNSPEWIKKYQQDIDKRTIVKLKEKDTDRIISSSQVLKTIDFGGHGIPFGSDQISVVNKTTLALKPKDIKIVDTPYNQAGLLNAIMSNEILKLTEPGNIVIEIARQLGSKQVPTVPKVDAKVKAAIQDDAGEYLGPLALLNQTAIDFPSIKEFVNHLKIKNISQLVLTFPEKINNPLGDSEGIFQNPGSGSKILISSKGQVGAAPSIQGLTIPDDLKQSSEFEKEIEFINLLQSTKKVNLGGTGQTVAYQPMIGLNWLKNNAPESVPQWVSDFLPLSDEEMATIISYADNKKYTIGNAHAYAKQVPAWLDQLFGKVSPTNRTKVTGSPGGLLLYYMSQAVKTAVNENNALPNFETIAREILQRNFIQINATVGSNMNFSVLWPNRQMATGTITLESKTTASDPMQSLAFRIK
jgi:hypothetical protein